MPKVFVVQDPHDKNILPAAIFGDIEVILFTADLERGYEHCVQRLQDSLCKIQEDDFILPIGDPIMIAIAGYMGFHFGEGSMNLLRWNKTQYKYAPVHLKL